MQLDPTAAPLSGISVDLQGIKRVFPGPVVAVDGIDLRIAPGAFVSILGPSGCGKSTLLRLIAGLDKPDSGSIQAGSDGTAHRHIGYVFQDAYLLPWRNALNNVALPLELIGVPRPERLAAAAKAIERVGLADASQPLSRRAFRRNADARVPCSSAGHESIVIAPRRAFRRA